MAIVLAEQFYGSVAKLANQHIMMKHGKFIRGRTGDDKESDGLRVSMSMSMSNRGFVRTPRRSDSP